MAKEEIAVLALSTDGNPDDWDYVLAAAPIGPGVWDFSYWYIPDPEPGDSYVILRAKVDEDDAADLIAHGTREQYFNDGYEAADVIDDAEVVESWSVDEDDEED